MELSFPPHLFLWGVFTRLPAYRRRSGRWCSPHSQSINVIVSLLFYCSHKLCYLQCLFLHYFLLERESTLVSGFISDVTEDSQGERLVPAGVEGGADGPGLLFGLVPGVWGELELDIRVWKSIWIHGDQVPGFTHCREEEVTKGGSQSALISRLPWLSHSESHESKGSLAPTLSFRYISSGSADTRMRGQLRKGPYPLIDWRFHDVWFHNDSYRFKSHSLLRHFTSGTVSWLVKPVDMWWHVQSPNARNVQTHCAGALQCRERENLCTSTSAVKRSMSPPRRHSEQTGRRRGTPRAACSFARLLVLGQRIMSWRCDSFRVIAVSWERPKEKGKSCFVATGGGLGCDCVPPSFCPTARCSGGKRGQRV